MGILRLGYLEIRVKEINKAAQYYTQVLGLKETARAAGKIYLKAWDEWEHHQLVLVEDPSPGLNHMAFRLESLDDLPFFENKLERNGCRVERVGGADKYELGEAIRFTAPSEHRVELYYDMTIVGNGLPTTNPPPYPDDLLGIHPPRMDHTLLTTPDTPASLHFWQEVMGFRLTEQVVTPEGMPLAIWLERTRTPHDLAFIPGKPGGLTPLCLLVGQLGSDWTQRGCPGPGRRSNRHRTDTARHHSRPYHLFFRLLWKSQ